MGRAYAHGAIVLAAFAGLGLGAAVYLLDRVPGSAMALPALPVGAGLFGALGGNLPSFAHTFAFSLLSALLVPRRRGWWAGACVFWATGEAALELLQRPAWALPTARALLGSEWPGADAVAAYLRHGRFDPIDVLAVALGAAAAWFLLVLAVQEDPR